MPSMHAPFLASKFVGLAVMGFHLKTLLYRPYKAVIEILELPNPLCNPFYSFPHNRKASLAKDWQIYPDLATAELRTLA